MTILLFHWCGDVDRIKQGRRSHRIIEDIKEDCGSGDGSPQEEGVQGRCPGREFGGQSPPEAEAFFVKLHIIFALKYNKQQT